MYNNNQFKKVNDKKVLHKIKKHWVTISIALISAIGGGAALTHTNNVNADTDQQNNNQANHMLSNNVLLHKTSLVNAQSNHSALYTSQSNKLNHNNTYNKYNLLHKVNNLHNHIITDIAERNSQKYVNNSSHNLNKINPKLLGATKVTTSNSVTNDEQNISSEANEINYINSQTNLPNKDQGSVSSYNSELQSISNLAKSNYSNYVTNNNYLQSYKNEAMSESALGSEENQSLATADISSMESIGNQMNQDMNLANSYSRDAAKVNQQITPVIKQLDVESNSASQIYKLVKSLTSNITSKSVPHQDSTSQSQPSSKESKSDTSVNDFVVNANNSMTSIVNHTNSINSQAMITSFTDVNTHIISSYATSNISLSNIVNSEDNTYTKTENLEASYFTDGSSENKISKSAGSMMSSLNNAPQNQSTTSLLESAQSVADSVGITALLNASSAENEKSLINVLTSQITSNIITASNNASNANKLLLNIKPSSSVKSNNSSESAKQSEDISKSASASKSTSVSASASASMSMSQSIRTSSISASVALSKATSIKASQSTSTSVSASASTSTSVSQSIKASTSASIMSKVMSMSAQSASVLSSLSSSASESVKASHSNSISASIANASKSASLSASASQSASVNNSISASNSISLSIFRSNSAKVASLDNNSASTASFDSNKSSEISNNVLPNSTTSLNSVTSSSTSTNINNYLPTIISDSTVMSIKANQINSMVSNPVWVSNYQASSAVSNDKEVISDAINNIDTDMRFPNSYAVKDADLELFNVMSASKNINQIEANTVATSTSFSGNSNQSTSYSVNSAGTNASYQSNLQSSSNEVERPDTNSTQNPTESSNGMTPLNNKSRRNDINHISGVNHTDLKNAKHETENDLPLNNKRRSLRNQQDINAITHTNDHLVKDYSNNQRVATNPYSKDHQHNNSNVLPQTGESPQDKLVAEILLSLSIELSSLGLVTKRRHNRY